MKIKVTNNKYEIVFELNSTPASKSFYDQLPLDTSVENYSNNEKVFNPPKSLNTKSSTLLKHGGVGTLAYFAPWNNIVMFYGNAAPYSGLYILGQATNGADDIHSLSGIIHIDKV